MTSNGENHLLTVWEQKPASAPCGASEGPALQAQKTLPNRWSERTSQKTPRLIVTMKPYRKSRINT